jgi:hypothetical protein
LLIDPGAGTRSRVILTILLVGMRDPFVSSDSEKQKRTCQSTRITFFAPT